MRRIASLVGLVGFAGASLALAACTDSATSPTAPELRPRAALTAPELFQRYVALGTSNSQGVQSAGIDEWAQRHAWPALLAAKVGVPFSLPLVRAPGCSPPLVPPLATDALLLGAFGAFGARGDLVGGVMTTCAPLQAGVVPPTNSVAISGANVHDALFSTIASEGGPGTRLGTLYSRILAPGQTQVTAMLAERPTFVSVELAANDVLPASTGLVGAMTPYADWQGDYDQVIAAVRSTGAGAALVGLPTDARDFPSIRSAKEFAKQWPYLLTLGITVSHACSVSSNYVFLPGYLLTLLRKTPATATCKDVPGKVDYVLTASDMTAINARMAQINMHIQAKANESGYAYFALSAVYDLPKPTLNLYDVLFTSTPFGANISLDGIHPSVQGQGILAAAAARAVSARYGVAIP